MPSPLPNLRETKPSDPLWHTLTIDRTLARLETDDRTDLTDRQIAFDSDRQRMSIICEQSPYYLLFAKGSPESIEDRSTHTLVEARYAELNEHERLKIRSQNASWHKQLDDNFNSILAAVEEGQIFLK